MRLLASIASVFPTHLHIIEPDEISILIAMQVTVVKNRIVVYNQMCNATIVTDQKLSRNNCNCSYLHSLPLTHHNHPNRFFKFVGKIPEGGDLTLLSVNRSKTMFNLSAVVGNKEFSIHAATVTVSLCQD